MKTKLAMLVITSSLLLTACATAPTQEAIATADYGKDMTPAECITLAETVVSNGFNDPSSAQFRHKPCFKGAMNSVPILGMKAAFGWIQQGEVNAKNVYGGYVGFRPYNVLIKDGSVVRYCVTDKDGLCMPTGR